MNRLPVITIFATVNSGSDRFGEECMEIFNEASVRGFGGFDLDGYVISYVWEGRPIEVNHEEKTAVVGLHQTIMAIDEQIHLEELSKDPLYQ